MGVYIWIYIFTFLNCFMGILTNKKIYYSILSMFIITLSSLRFDTGFDYYWYWLLGDKTYSNHFYYNFMYDKIELFFKKIYDLCRILDKPELFFIITSIITFSFIFGYIKKNSKTPYLSAAYFIYTSYFFRFSLFFVRQAVAVAIITYYSNLVVKGKKKLFILIIVLTSLFIHSSAIVGVIFLLLENRKIKIKFFLFSSIGIIILKEILVILASKVSLISKYGYLLQKNSRSELLGNRALLFFLLIILVMLIYELKNKKKLERLYIYNRNLFLVGFFLYITCKISFSGHLPYRISWYFLIHILVVISYLTNELKNKKVIQLLLIVVLFFKADIEIIKENYRNNIIQKSLKTRRDDLYYFWINRPNFHVEQVPKLGE